jgi:exopolysaccharide production protein ExoQ
MIASRSLAGWMGAAGENESGSSLDRSVLIGLGVAGMVIVARRRFDWFGALRRHGGLLALLGYTLISLVWSDIALVALKRWVREIIVVIMALTVMSERNPSLALESLMRRTAYVLIPLSLVLVKYYPLAGRMYGRWSGVEMWTGVATQKNGLGRLCMISALFLLWDLFLRSREQPRAGGLSRRWADLGVVAMGFYLLVGSHSATATATLGVGVTIFLGLRWLKKLKIAVPQAGLMLCAMIVIGYGVATPFLGGSNVAAFTSSLGRDETLTGRTEVWAELVPVVETQPLLGAGFESYWTDARRTLHQISHGHNGYLDVLLTLGAVGLTFTIVWVLSCIRRLHSTLAWDYDWGALALSYLMVALVYNATESTLTSFTEHMSAMILLPTLVLTAAGRRKDVRAGRAAAAEHAA